MSGSFRIEDEAGTATPGEFHYDRSKDPAHHGRLPSLERQGCDLQRSAPLRLHGYVRTKRAFARASTSGMSASSRWATNSMARFSRKGLPERKTPLKAALLDQSLIAGLGNIYVCEALHRAAFPTTRGRHAVAKERNAYSKRPAPLRLSFAKFSRKPLSPAGLPYAIIVRRTARSATSSIPSAVMIAKASPARTRLQVQHQENRTERPIDLLLRFLSADNGADDRRAFGDNNACA